ncbi:MAG TPA: hypothetical protein VJ385_20595 [Fibrobacteria bacterium]|nr:hypothetical protein [Fibrobacteria bacterium]
MKESVVRDLIGNNLVRLINGGLQGVYPDSYAGKAVRPEGIYTVQSPVVLTQLALSPASQVLSFLVMETDSMVRLGKRMLPDRPRDEALKLVVSANAEILNFVSSRLAWLLSKLENAPDSEISPPKVGNFSGPQAYRIRADEGVFLEFACAPQKLAFRFASCIQAVA